MKVAVDISLYPLDADDARLVRLELWDGGTWRPVAEAETD